jgi:hypothetical protein
MAVCHSQDIFESAAAQALRQFIQARRQTWQAGTPAFEQFERDLHAQVMAVERELVAAELARYDVSAEQINVGGVRYQRVLADTEMYLSAAGPVQVERHLYRPAGHNSRSICPLELRVGIVAGYWTPRAARLAAYVSAELTAEDAAKFWGELGNMQPSRASLGRLPAVLSGVWEGQRLEWEASLRAAETVPAAAISLAVSVDGVMVAMKAAAAERQAKKAAAGKHGSGPAGKREVGCATVSVYDAAGERLQTVRYGRMPEALKVSLQAQVLAETDAILGVRPDLRRVHLADGAQGNWTWLADLARQQAGPNVTWVEIVDFFHACEHLQQGCDAIWGESTPRSQAEFARLKLLLKDDASGRDRVVRCFRYHAGRLAGARRQRLVAEQRYFRNQYERMDYPAYQREHLPIASGVIEATCKTLVTQRLKRSGMAWSPAGGQALLTLRSLIQSDRWLRAWDLLAAAFRQPISIPAATAYSTLPLAG